MKSTVLLAPQYSGFWKAYFPFLVATKADDRKEVLIQGVLVTKDNVDAALKLADDQVTAIADVPVREAAGRHRRDLLIRHIASGSPRARPRAGAFAAPAEIHESR